MIAEEKTNAGTRIPSMLLDHLAMTFIAMIFMVPGMISRFSIMFDITHDQFNTAFLGESSYFGLIGFALYFCKDSINGRSIAKRLLKLQVVKNSNGKVATPIRCFIRNLFCVLWPLEVIITLVSPSRRIGDLIAGTRVVPFNEEREQLEINYLQIGLSFILACGLIVLMMLPIENMKAKIKSNQITYIESSLNQKAAEEAEKLFAESLGADLTPDIRVYDQIEGEENLKYVSVILRLKKNYLEKEDSYEQIKSTTVKLLLTKFKEGTFVGQIKYVYKQSGSMQVRRWPLDWREKE